MLHFARIGEGALGIGHAGGGWVGEDDFAIGLQRADESVAGGIGLEEAAGPAGAPSAEVGVEHHRAFALFANANGDALVRAALRRGNVPADERPKLHLRITRIHPIAFALFTHLLGRGSNENGGNKAKHLQTHKFHR